MDQGVGRLELLGENINGWVWLDDHFKISVPNYRWLFQAKPLCVLRWNEIVSLMAGRVFVDPSQLDDSWVWLLSVDNCSSTFVVLKREIDGSR